MKPLLILALIPAMAFGANEAQIGCDLARAQAEVQATQLIAPSAFADIGDPSTPDQSVAAGLSQSVSGIFRAKELRQSADAKCDAIIAETNLDLYEKWAILSAQRKGDIAEQNGLDESVALQKDYISTLTAQYNAQLTTEDVLKGADLVYINTVQSQAVLAKNLAIEIVPPPDGDLNDLIKEASIKEGTSAMLSAKSTANGGWDFSISAGVRTPINGGGSTQGFITAQAKYSFGTNAAQKAARIVGEKTTELLNAASAGYNLTIQRNKTELLKLITIEDKDQSALNREVSRIDRLRQPLIGIDSTLAKNAISEIDIQLSILKATLAGSVARLQAYTVLLNRFTLIK